MKHTDGITGYREVKEFQTIVILKYRNGYSDYPKLWESSIYTGIKTYREIWEW